MKLTLWKSYVLFINTFILFNIYYRAWNWKDSVGYGQSNYNLYEVLEHDFNIPWVVLPKGYSGIEHYINIGCILTYNTHIIYTVNENRLEHKDYYLRQEHTCQQNDQHALILMDYLFRKCWHAFKHDRK